MRKQVLFVVHGIGEHAEGWSDEFAELLAKQWDAIDTCTDIERSEGAFEVVPLSYDAVFEDIRRRWKEDREAVTAALGGLEAPDELIGPLLKVWESTEKNSFVNTHALDLLLYYTVPMVRARVCVTVYNKLLQHLIKGPLPEWSIIGHSMGTSVVHDVLQGASINHWEAIGGALPSAIRPHVICMLANCCALLEKKGDSKQYPGKWPWDVYQSNVWPGRTTEGRMSRYYLNVTHRLDPVSMPKPFSPSPHWPGRLEDASTPAGSMKPYVDVALKVVLDENLHAITHFAQDPRFYVPLFRMLGGRKAVSVEKENDLIKAHEAESREQIRTRIEQALKFDDMGRVGDFQVWIKRLIKYLRGI
ncbi:MAG TPA: hypothetical protein VGE57_09145 [Solimonas sp.]